MHDHISWEALNSFPGLDTPEEIKAAATTRVAPRSDLGDVPAYLIDSEVRKHLAGLYIPSSEEVTLIQKFVGMARAHRARNYVDPKDYFQRLYHRGYQGNDFRAPVCLTGPAGVGKSSLMQAVHRILPQSQEVNLGPQGGRLRASASWFICAQDRSTVSKMLRPFVQAEWIDAPKDTTQAVAGIIFKNAVSLIILDEMQFMTQSAQANTAVTKALYQFSHLGAPLVFVANYSLCNLLLRRPEQDRQRLLATPSVLFPSRPDSEDWKNYLTAVTEALSPTLQVDLASRGFEMFEKTAGLKRLLIHLICSAYATAWERGRRQVAASDLAEAFGSTGYSVHRKQVQAMLIEKPSKTNAQYQCPFPLVAATAEAVANDRAVARERRLAEELQKELLRPIAHQAAAHIQKISDKSRETLAAAPTPKKPVRRAGKLSAAELLQTEVQRKGGGPLMPR